MRQVEERRVVRGEPKELDLYISLEEMGEEAGAGEQVKNGGADARVVSESGVITAEEKRPDSPETISDDFGAELLDESGGQNETTPGE